MQDINNKTVQVGDIVKILFECSIRDQLLEVTSICGSVYVHGNGREWRFGHPSSIEVVYTI